MLGKEERQVHLQTPKAFIATHLGSRKQRIYFVNVKPVALWTDLSEWKDQSQSCGTDLPSPLLVIVTLLQVSLYDFCQK